MERIAVWRELSADEAKRESQIKEQILAKVAKRMSETRSGGSVEHELRAELNPDVILISTSDVLFFEPQNWRASEWLHQRCALSMDNAQMRDRIAVHPCQREKIITDLKAAGFEVVC